MARIMICDDSAFMRLMLKKILVDNGHEIVGEASDGREAVKVYRQTQPALVTMDITMPHIDGIEAVKIIRDEDPAAKIIMVTAMGQRTVIVEAIKAGACDFIIKPFETEEVVKTINKALK